MNRKSNCILTGISISFMLIFNFAFNIFNDAININSDGQKLKKSTEVIEMTFNKDTTLNEFTNIMTDLSEFGVESAFSNDVEFLKKSANSTYKVKKIANVYAITNNNLFDFNISSGRKITEKDILEKRKVVIISHDYSDLIYKNNDIEYIDINNEPYEVIGIIKGRDGKSFYNANMFIPYSSYPEKWEKSIKIEENLSNALIASKNIIGNLNYFNEKKYGVENYSTREPLIASINDNLMYLKDDLINFYIIALAALVNIILFAFYWIKTRKRSFSIYKALGYTPFNIYIIILKELIGITVFSVFFSNLIYYLIEINFAKYIFNMSIRWSYFMIPFNIILSIILILIIILLSSFTVNSKAIDKNINLSSTLSSNKFIKLIIIFQIVVMTLNLINLFEMLNYYNLRIDKLEKISVEDQLFFTHPATVPKDFEEVSNIQVESIMKDLDENGIETINYFYDTEVLKDNIKITLNDDTLRLNNFMFSEDVHSIQNGARIIYIEKDEFDKYFNIDSHEIINDTNSVDVIAGKKYSKEYKINDILETKAGKKYRLKGFLKTDTFYDDNRSERPMSELIDLNDKIIIPISNINQINSISEKYKNNLFEFNDNILRNSIYRASSKEEVAYLNEKMSELGISLIDKNYSIDSFNFEYRSLIGFKSIVSILTVIISFAGIISFLSMLLLENKKIINIKFSLGYRKSHILKEILFNIVSLFCIAYGIVFIIFIAHPYKNINFITIKFMILSLICIVISIVGIVNNNLNKFKVTSLSKED